MIHLNVTPPSQFDGEPKEVALTSVRQLVNVLEEVKVLAQQTQAQVVNSGMTEALRQGVDDNLVQWVEDNLPAQSELSDQINGDVEAATDDSRSLVEAVEQGR